MFANHSKEKNKNCVFDKILFLLKNPNSVGRTKGSNSKNVHTINEITHTYTRSYTLIH